MTELEARTILENYREADDDTGEEYGHKIIRCLGGDNDGYIFECKSDGYLDLNAGVLVKSTNATYQVAVYPDETVICLPQ